MGQVYWLSISWEKSTYFKWESLGAWDVLEPVLNFPQWNCTVRHSDCRWIWTSFLKWKSHSPQEKYKDLKFGTDNIFGLYGSFINWWHLLGVHFYNSPFLCLRLGIIKSYYLHVMYKWKKQLSLNSYGWCGWSWFKKRELILTVRTLLSTYTLSISHYQYRERLLGLQSMEGDILTWNRRISTCVSLRGAVRLDEVLLLCMFNI